MIAIRTVVCPVDFSAATTRQLEQAGDICHAFGARLVLHHNVTDVAVGAGVGWMWHADHVPPAPAASDGDLRALLKRVPPDISTDACVTRGAITEAVLSVGEGADAAAIPTSDGMTTASKVTSDPHGEGTDCCQSALCTCDCLQHATIAIAVAVIPSGLQPARYTASPRETRPAARPLHVPLRPPIT